MAAWRAILLATAALLPCACSSEPSTSAAVPAEPDRIDVVAAFYPLQFVTERVGGDAVSVTNLTPAGSEPHELELSARDAGHLQDADVVVYLDGFAPALDDTIDDVDAHGFDVAAAADLDRTAGSAHDTDDDEATGADPHFWLDPLRLAAVGRRGRGRARHDRPRPRRSSSPPTPPRYGASWSNSTASSRPDSTRVRRRIW